MSERNDFIRQQAAALQVARCNKRPYIEGDTRWKERYEAESRGAVAEATALADALGLTDAPAPECYAIPKAVCDKWVRYFDDIGGPPTDPDDPDLPMLASIQHARGAQ